MYSVQEFDADMMVCDECDSFGLSAKVSDHDNNIMEFYCRDCKSEWVEYV